MIDKIGKKCFKYTSFTYLFIFKSILFGIDSVYLWDLGLVINPKPNQKFSMDQIVEAPSETKQFALIADRHINAKEISLKAKKPDNSILKREFQKLSFSGQISHINNYFLSERFTESINLLNKIDIQKLSGKEYELYIKIYVESLFNLGNYQDAHSMLKEFGDNNMNDSLLFLFGISQNKIGDNLGAKNTFSKILINYPESDFSSLAKLQIKVLSR